MLAHQIIGKRDKTMSDQKQFDVVIYGASGFTGRLVAEYMAKQYGTSASWAMAGRCQ
jgi:short subunit dehydrogenase-like uncharacterized protein